MRPWIGYIGFARGKPVLIPDQDPASLAWTRGLKMLTLVRVRVTEVVPKRRKPR